MYNILSDYEKVQMNVEDPENQRKRSNDLNADVNHVFGLMQARQMILDQKKMQEEVEV